MNACLSLKDILLEKMPCRGWLYLPKGILTLETMGIFVESDKNAEPDSVNHIPDVVKENKWIVTIDADTVEDIIWNAKAQISNIDLNDLFKAFIHYIENDAFIVF